MMRSSGLSRVLLLQAVGMMLGVACTKSGQTLPDTSAAAGRTQPAATVGRHAATDPKDIVAYARTYDYPVHTTQKPASVPILRKVNNGVPKGSEPQTLWIAKAQVGPNTKHPADQEALALVHSDRSYPGLGISQGDNYIWRDNTSHQVWMVSDSPPSIIELTRDSKPYSHGSPEEPRLVFETVQTLVNSVRTDMVVYGICLEDPSCGGHCGYSQ